jgi:two-component system response regulator FlrC
MALPQKLWNQMEELGYKVILADDEEMELKKIRKIAPRLWVGQINGNPDADLSLLEEVRLNYPDLPILLSSRKPGIEEAVRAIKLGANEYLPAGITSEQLGSMVERLLSTQAVPIHHTPSRKGNAARNRHFPVAVHDAMKQILNLARKIAPSRSTILIQGESGTGKEVIAKYIHEHSTKNTGPFIAVNCAALPENLLESELFGHEKGAFTGAVSRKKGKFELAVGGTILLDEISEMPLSLQAKLLRVLQEKEIDRVGGQSAITVDVRVIATTNRNLQAEVKEGNFRSDLFYRLNVVPLVLPPLRKRKEDIIPLADFFLKEHGASNNLPHKVIAPAAEKILKAMPWPGNVRELENLMERATLLVDAEEIEAKDLEFVLQLNADTPADGENGDDPLQLIPLREMEKRMILKALDDHNGNRTHASKILGISVRTLRNKLHEYKKDLEKEIIP